MDMENVNFSSAMFKELGELLRCQLCSDYMSYCVILSCSHHFCNICIRKRMLTKNYCPSCSEEVKETDLRNDKLVDKIVRNYKKLRLENLLNAGAKCLAENSTQTINSEDQTSNGEVFIRLEKDVTDEIVSQKDNKDDSSNDSKSLPLCIVNSSDTSVSSSSCSSLADNSSPLNWYDHFKIPWNRMPSTLMRILNKRGRPSMSLRRKMIQIICNAVRRFSKNPGKKILTVIANRVFKRYPKSLCDNSSVFPPYYTCDLLTKQFITRMDNLNRKTKQISKVAIGLNPKSNLNEQCSSSNSSLGECKKTTTEKSPNDDMFVNSQCDQMLKLNNQPVNTTVNNLADMDSSGNDTELVGESKSSQKQIRNTSESCPNWYEKFSIPWDNMPSSLIDYLNQNLVPDPKLLQTMIRIICNEIREFDPKPSKYVLRMIAGKAVERYPYSLCDYINEEPQLDKCNTLTAKIANRLANVASGKCLAVSPLDSFFNNAEATPDESVREPTSEWYTNFEIPWKQMPSELLSLLCNNLRLSVPLRRTMVKVICDKIRKYEVKPTMKVIDIIAKKAFQTYPNSLCDDPDVDELRGSYRDLRTQLHNRLLNYFRVKVSMIDVYGESNKNPDKVKKCSPSKTGRNDDSRNSESDDTVAVLSDEYKNSNLVNPHVKCENGDNSLSQSDDPCDSTNGAQNGSLPSLSRRSNNQSVISKWESNFVLPWDKMPNNVLKALKEGRPIDRKMRMEMVRTTCEEIRKVTYYPDKDSLSCVARKMIESYPNSLLDSFSGEIPIKDCDHLTYQLRYTVENQNRRDNIAKRRCVSFKKNSVINHYLYISSDPKEFTEQEIKESQQQKIELKSIAASFDGIFNPKIIKLLDASFYYQREDIINAEDIINIMKEWPLLFTVDGFLNHFKMLVGVDILQRFKSNFSLKTNTIFYYLMSISNDASQKNLQYVFQELDHLSDVNKVGNPAVLMFLIMAYFNEERENLFCLVSTSTTKTDIEKIVDLPKSPHLIVCGESIFHGSSFMLSIDGIVVNDRINSFEKGIVILFVSYYIFNIVYAEKAKSTLQFIQRFLFNINSNENANLKTENTIDVKVISLIETLTNNQH